MIVGMAVTLLGIISLWRRHVGAPKPLLVDLAGAADARCIGDFGGGRWHRLAVEQHRDLVADTVSLVGATAFIERAENVPFFMRAVADRDRAFQPVVVAERLFGDAARSTSRCRFLSVLIRSSKYASTFFMSATPSKPKKAPKSDGPTK